MARKKKKDEVENYFNNVANYQTEAEARAVTPEGVKVFCAFDELVPIGKVVPNPGNPNTHPPKQVALLAAIIKGQGWRKPITVSKRSGFVVTGHGRLEAAQSMQASVVPVEYQEYASEAEEYADLMADNRLAELSEMNTSALADMKVSLLQINTQKKGNDTMLVNLTVGCKNIGHYDSIVSRLRNIRSVLSVTRGFGK